MPVINKEPLFVDKINDILTTAFGNKIEGNIRYALGVDDSWLTTDNYLDLISKKRWFGRYPIGKFLERDGSSLILQPKYKEQAEEYCRLYEKGFHREATVELGNPFR